MSTAEPDDLMRTFTEEMDRLWRESGKPTAAELLKMAQKAGANVSKTALWDVKNGKPTSTWQSVEGFLKTVGQDPKLWRDRWQQAKEQYDDRMAAKDAAGGQQPTSGEPAAAPLPATDNTVTVGREDPVDTADDASPPPAAATRRMFWIGVAVAAVLSSLISVLVTLAVADNRGGEPDAPGRVIEVQNQIAIGADGLIEDPNGPAYLSSRPQPKCAQHDCKIGGTDMQTGALLVVDCQITNGASMVNYNVQANDAQNNPHKAQSARWYRGRFPDGRNGYLSEIFIAPKYRGGLGLPTCSELPTSSALDANGPHSASGMDGAGGDTASTPAGAARPLTKDDVDATCKVNPAPARGAQVTLTYTITVKAEGRLDLGAEIYADDATPFADGFGDLHSYLLKAGTQTVSRPLSIPATLKPGNYEIVGELWPDGEISKGDTIAGPTCATFSVS